MACLHVPSACSPLLFFICVKRSFVRAASIGLARGLGTSARQNVVAGAAAAIEPTLATPAGQVPFLSDEERQKYAESIGFTKVGKHLPDEVTLQDVIKTLPSEVSPKHQ